MEEFKMQFVHPSTESEFIDWLNSPVNSIANTDHVFKTAINQIQNADWSAKVKVIERKRIDNIENVSRIGIVNGKIDVKYKNETSK